MSGQYSKIQKSDLIFPRNNDSKFWHDKYDCPKQHCPYCGNSLDTFRTAYALVTEVPEEADPAETWDKECPDCGLQYVSLRSEWWPKGENPTDINSGRQL